MVSRVSKMIPLPSEERSAELLAGSVVKRRKTAVWWVRQPFYGLMKSLRRCNSRRCRSGEIAPISPISCAWGSTAR